MGSAISTRKRNKKLADITTAIIIGNPEAIKLLKEFPNWQKYHLRQSDWTFLHLASWYGHFNLVNEMIHHGCDPSSIDSNYETPLHISAYKGDKKTTEILLNFIPEITENRDGKTPLLIAQELGHTEVIELIQGYGMRKLSNKKNSINSSEFKKQVNNFVIPQ
ncbi:unnamed protein product [Blepharisma stoltei]|uniref:Ankyrin repeat protein n=1 Tax=Blepharisma stoltei TaxID=1481888 RepID=A0AAU9K0J1_9CILI|nr:unnamed protein product [Blepharisma stoltei]